MNKFDTIIENMKIPKQFLTKVSDLTPDELKKQKEQKNIEDKEKETVKKLNGVTRQNKYARDLHDKKIQDRDNDVQTTAVEVEE